MRTRIIQILCALLFIGAFVTLIYFITETSLPILSYNAMYEAYEDKEYEEVVEIYSQLGPQKEEHANKLLAAWSYFKLNDVKKAKQLFQEVVDEDPNQEEAKFGLAYTELYDHNANEALAYMQKLHAEEPENPQYGLLLAMSYFRVGDNRKAAEVYQKLIAKRKVHKEAREHYRDLFGDSRYTKHELDELFPPYEKNEEGKSHFRTAGDYFEIYKEGKWEPIFMRGVNLSPAPPGYTITEPPLKFEVYKEWLLTLATMNTNLVRIYDLLPPAFYQALKAHNESHRKKIWLLQEIWLNERDVADTDKKEAYDIYDPSWAKEFQEEIIQVIDAVHGRANVSYVRGHAAGFYTADVSPYLFGYVLGRELEPFIVRETNEKHKDRVSFNGEYFRASGGGATEVWIAEMLEFAAAYEKQMYDQQHLLSFVTWAPLDPLHHESEGTVEDLALLYREHNLKPDFTIPKFHFENDEVTLDTTKITATSNLESGYFILFHAYAYWPDFIFREKQFMATRDQFGPNPWFGYLQALKALGSGVPYMLGEFGIPTNWSPSHISPGSWNHGGYSEKEQGEILSRMVGNIVDANYAGCCIFELFDEWWKLTYSSYPYDMPHTNAYWQNIYNAEQTYGLMGFTSLMPIPQLRGKKSDWKNATTISKGKPLTGSSQGNIKALYAYSDEIFFYIRLDLASMSKRAFEDAEYWVALNTLPEKAGARTLPGIDLTIPTGANFLVKIKGNGESKILIANNYNPFQMKNATLPFVKEKWLTATPMKAKLAESVPFEEINFLVNNYKNTRDGTLYPPIGANRSTLHYGTADLKDKDYFSHASWHINSRKNMLEIRLPWSLLFAMDPTNHYMMSEIKLKRYVPMGYEAIPEKTDGFALVALQIAPNGDGNEILSILPEKKGNTILRHNMKLYTWKRWLKPNYESYLKASFYDIKEKYKKIENARISNE